MLPYAELRAKSAFSFLRASSDPEDLVERAVELGLSAVALADLDGLYGAPRFYKAAREAGLRSLVGADLTLSGERGQLLLLVKNRIGYRNLCRLISLGHAGRPKGQSAVSLSLLAEHAEGLLCLTGGALDRSLQSGQAEELLTRLQAIFAKHDLWVELGRHFERTEARRNASLVELAKKRGLSLVATNDVRYARVEGRRLHDVFLCLHHKLRLDEAGTRLPPNAEHCFKSAADMQALFADLPEAIDNTLRVAERCAFTLEDLGYRFPDFPVPAGETPFSYLHRLVQAGARWRYRPLEPRHMEQISRELALIAKLELAGYFLVVWDIARFCREQHILSQGRGSAANSAVCYALGITAVDPIGMNMLFERFLSEERGSWPDIDLDLPSGDQREKVIQYVYKRYGRHGAAMTANVITYRQRSAVREVGKVLGLDLDRLSRAVGLARGPIHPAARVEGDMLERGLRDAGFDPTDPRVRLLLELTREIQHLPRHLGQHSGGMVLAQGRLDEVVPLEPASMPGRVIVQWDKEDCADLGIIKVDLLGLGMMSALQDTITTLKETGVEVDLARLPPDDPKVYAMLQKADTVGVFQVESRAQMATLPRMKPERFYDLVVEVAIIRPGPIVGKMVHPYLRRRNGLEPVTYAHPLLEPILKRTLGVPLFQEQLLRMAMAVGGFSGGEAEELRRAMGFKRSEQRMKPIEERLRAGMRERGISGSTADDVVRSIVSFALYGFPESHAASFALIAYASAWLKTHHPAAFTCALLNNQPMGFYHPSTLVKDAQRHGVHFRAVDVIRSARACRLEEGEVRLGLGYVRGLRAEAADRVVVERETRPYESLQDFVDRNDLRRDEQRALAEVGALNAFGLTRRSALWQVEKAGRPRGPLLSSAGDETEEASPVPEMDLAERLSSDLLGTGLTAGPHLVSLCREELQERGVRRADELSGLGDGNRVRVAGAVICRQRPGTAKGFMFLTLEDETGLVNIIVRPDLFHRERPVLTGAPVLEVDGVLQANDGLSVRAFAVRSALPGFQKVPCRDFH
jgi:error-prone DNA polymerase